MPKKIPKKKLKTFKDAFEARKKEILDKLSKIDNEIDFDGDEVDVVQGMVISGLNEQLSKRDINTLGKINIALKKIEDGSFGACDECEGPIGEKRLMALPGVSNCITCAEEAEKTLKHYG